MKGLGSMPWKELGKRQFSTTWIEIIKQNVAFLFYGSNSGSLFTQSSELEVDSLQFSCQSLWLWGVPSQPMQHQVQGNEENPDQNL